MSKKSFVAARRFLENGWVFTVIGLRLPITMLVALAEPMLFGLLFLWLYMRTFYPVEKSVNFLVAGAMILISIILVPGILVRDIRFPAKTETKPQ